MTFRKRAIITVIIIFICVGCDRVTKIVAKKHLPPYQTISFLQDTVRLQYAENTGAFLSFGANIPDRARFLIFTVLVGLFLFGLLLFQLFSSQFTRMQVVAMSLILGGGFGNMIDRVAHEGRVFDFMNVGLGQLRTGVFNVADMCITSGVLWFLYLAFRDRNKTTPGSRDSGSESPVEA